MCRGFVVDLAAGWSGWFWAATVEASLARGALRGRESDEAHELGCVGEAVDVADLGGDPERGQRVDAAQTAQPGHQRRGRGLGGERGGLSLERCAPRVDEVERVQMVVEGRLPRRLVNALLS